MRNGVALIMVLLVLSALAIIGAPFVISMSLQEKASLNFEGAVVARQAAEAARNHAIAHLEKSVYGYEYEEEEEILDGERPRTSVKVSSKPAARRGTSYVPRRQTSSSRRGMVVRKDRGEAPMTREEKEEQRRRGQNRLNPNSRTDPTGTDAGSSTHLTGAMKTSKKGPSPREFDDAAELNAKPLDRVELPTVAQPAATGTTFVASALNAKEEFRFQDPAGVTASAIVSDEQGKININTAPPNLIANLFGAGQLALPLSPRDTKLILEDASSFRGDMDGDSIDGAVVVVDAEAGVTEAVTYRKKDGDTLDDCFRGAYLSLILNHVFPAGSFVYDLRGWKVGYHRLWAQREGGFHPRELTKFSCVEAIREIASWQIASLFVTRFRGEGLTAELLRQAGVQPKKVSDLGLDPYIFPGAGVDGEGDQAAEIKKKLEEAKRQLRKAGLKSDVVTKLKDARGPRVVIDLAARLDGADKERVKRVEADLEKSLTVDKRRSTVIPEKYLQEALKQLAEAYRTPGLETVEPADLEWLRDCVTVSSIEPAEWSETQSVIDDVSLAGPEYIARIPRATELNPGTVVRIRSASDESSIEFNEAAPTGKNIPQGGIRFAYPLLGSVKGYDGTVQGLQRHPVNINTASRRVLRAIFTGVRGYEEKQVVTPYKADRLAARVESAKPFKGHDDFRSFLEQASSSGIIDAEDVQPLLINAIQPTHNLLRVSTTGFTYATGDVYAVESRGVLRSPTGTTIADSRFREIVEVSAARRMSVGLMTQADFSDGVFLKDPLLQPGFPENRHQYLLQFPGARSHLVLSRPLLLHRAPLSFPGGDLSNLRLFPAETPETMPRFTLGKIEHFRESYEGLELAQGETYPISLELDKQGTGGGGGGGGASAAGSGYSALNMVPGGFELWFRMRTYPDARNEDGHLILFDAGTEEERNRISVLYDVQQGNLHLRISDASIRDPSVERKRDNGQYLDITARRPLELETWYHLRAVWDGVFGGGAQLFIDGIPAGTDNLSSELMSAIPAQGDITSIAVKDASKFPREGVVRIDQELFEYKKAGNSLQLRREQASTWQPIQRSKARRTRGRLQPPEPPPPNGGGRGGKDELPDAAGGGLELGIQLPPEEEIAAQAAPGGQGTGSNGPAVDMTIKRAPGNRRGSVPAAHSAGARVALHGYSLEMRRKLRDPKGSEYQISDGDGSKLLWGPGGLRTAEPLYAFNFPPDVSGILHVDFDPKEVGGNGDFLVPLFHLDSGQAVQGGWFVDRMSATSPLGARNAVDYFQSKGVLNLDGQAYFYRKEDLPPTYIASQAKYPTIIEKQTKGLRILADYASAGGGSLTGWKKFRSDLERDRMLIRGFEFGVPLVISPLTHRSLLVSGPIRGLYPDSGILELRGTPTPWENYRQSFYGQPVFGKNLNPDDVVEWIRYVEIRDEPIGGEQFHLFVGRTGGNFNFRGYPERDDPSLAVDLRKQLDHPINEPVRLVMELSEGGAGYGDYVTIATRDPSVYEPMPRRVFKVLEHDDGRFFVSLLEVGESGVDLPNSPAKYKNSYTMSMNPRLVKFPTWGLPEIGAAKGLFFGDVVQGSGSGGAGRSNVGGVRENEDEDPTGITIDEVRKLQNRTILRDPRYTVRHVVVPLEGGSVQFRGGGPGGASISGRISTDKSISRASPLDILVVTLSRERGFPGLFARGENEGVLRIGDELFYFEDPLGGQGNAAGGNATRQGQAIYGGGNATNPNPTDPANPADPNVVVNETSKERDPLARTTIWDRINAAGMTGHFEREGFARLEDRNAERQAFHEVFYYKQLSGGFSQCLRGQFGTPISQNTTAGIIHNVSRRLRLVGRSLLGSERAAHSLGEAVSLVPYMNIQPVTGPLTQAGLPVKKTDGFGRSGYLLLDSGVPTAAWEIMAHLGQQGEGLLGRPRDERGKGILRASFGTKEQPISNEYFAYDMPYRFPDRYEAETDSESLAYFQRSFRIPGAYWKSIEWTERPSKTLRDRRADVVILARFDGGPEWDVKATNAEGGLYFLEDRDRRENQPARADLERMADQLEIRIYFRFPSGAFSRLPNNRFTDDWKETPILESLTVEYEKAGAIVRHEELPF